VSLRQSAIVWIVCGAASLAAQRSWLPAPVQQGLTQQLAQRLTAIEPGQPAAQAQGAGKVVLSVAQRIDTWTERGVLDRAPTFPRLSLPVSANRHLDALSRYQVCNMALFPQFESSGDANTRRGSAFGMTAITMAVVRMREPFVAGGGTDGQMEAFLTSRGMAVVLEGLLATPDLLTYVEGRCEPVVRDLLTDAF
jgi:hypothetical protein